MGTEQKINKSYFYADFFLYETLTLQHHKNYTFAQNTQNKKKSSVFVILCLHTISQLG